MKVYLAGTITGDTATHQWRRQAASDLSAIGVATLDPLRGKDLRALSEDGLRSDIPATLFVTRDEMDIERADVILMNTLGVEDLMRPSIGTWAEMGLAHDKHKPLIIIADHVTVEEHPFIIKWATLVVPTLRKAVEAIRFLKE